MVKCGAPPPLIILLATPMRTRARSHIFGLLSSLKITSYTRRTFEYRFWSAYAIDHDMDARPRCLHPKEANKSTVVILQRFCHSAKIQISTPRTSCSQIVHLYFYSCSKYQVVNLINIIDAFRTQNTFLPRWSNLSTIV